MRQAREQEVGAREFRPFAAAVSGEASCDVGRDAGVRPAIAAHKQIEPPALVMRIGYLMLPPTLVPDCSRPGADVDGYRRADIRGEPNLQEFGAYDTGQSANQGAGGAPKKPTTRLMRPSGARS